MSDQKFAKSIQSWQHNCLAREGKLPPEHHQFQKPAVAYGSRGSFNPYSIMYGERGYNITPSISSACPPHPSGYVQSSTVLGGDHYPARLGHHFPLDSHLVPHTLHGCQYYSNVHHVGLNVGLYDKLYVPANGDDPYKSLVHEVNGHQSSPHFVDLYNKGYTDTFFEGPKVESTEPLYWTAPKKSPLTTSEHFVTDQNDSLMECSQLAERTYRAKLNSCPCCRDLRLTATHYGSNHNVYPHVAPNAYSRRASSMSSSIFSQPYEGHHVGINREELGFTAIKEAILEPTSTPQNFITVDLRQPHPNCGMGPHISSQAADESLYTLDASLSTCSTPSNLGCERNMVLNGVNYQIPKFSSWHPSAQLLSIVPTTKAESLTVISPSMLATAAPRPIVRVNKNHERHAKEWSRNLSQTNRVLPIDCNTTKCKSKNKAAHEKARENREMRTLSAKLHSGMTRNGSLMLRPGDKIETPNSTLKVNTTTNKTKEGLTSDKPLRESKSPFSRSFLQVNNSYTQNASKNKTSNNRASTSKRSTASAALSMTNVNSTSWGSTCAVCEINNSTLTTIRSGTTAQEVITPIALPTTQIIK